MKNKIDALDIQILQYLQKDARNSLKQLSKDLKRKTSTIYHRLSRLKSNNVILGYTIIFNPDFLDIKKIAIQRVKVKPLNISSLDDMFLESFASFINSEFPQVLFIALSEDNKVIYLISIHQNDEEHDSFLKVLRENPYIEDIETEFLSQIIKGQKLFQFNEKWLKSDSTKVAEGSKGPSFEDEFDFDDEEDKRTIEINIDDEEELKF